MKSKSAAPRARALSDRLSALMVVSALIMAPVACAQSTPDSKPEQQTAAKADPAVAPVDAAAPAATAQPAAAATPATAAAPAAEAKAAPANPCAPKPKKKPRNPCE